MLKNKIIVVTGGAGRLGQTFVNAIAQNGGIAIAADIDFNAAELIAADVTEDAIGWVVAAQLDITSKKSILELYKTSSS